MNTGSKVGDFISYSKRGKRGGGPVLRTYVGWLLLDPTVPRRRLVVEQ